jgi:hypothetical protein
MDSDKDYIENLYSEKFRKFEIQNSEDEWNMLSSKLGKSNFLKFSFATFNVYFLFIILSFATVTGYLGVTNFTKSNKIETLQHKIDLMQNQENKNETNSIIADSVENEQEISSKNNKINIQNNFQKKPENQKNKDDKKSVVLNMSDLSSPKDTVYTKPDSSSYLKPEPLKINRVKKTIYIKKDKVIVTDTVIIKKKIK